MKIDIEQLKANATRIHESLVIVLVCLVAEPTALSLVLGLIVSLVGVMLRIWTAGFPRDTRRFSVYGPYRFVRHPYHLGTFLLLLGTAIASRSAWVTAFMLLGMVLVYRAIVHEEEALEERASGTAFKDYRANVSSFLPSLVPYRRSADYRGAFSARYAIFSSEDRELESLVVLIVGYGLLYGFMAIKEFGGVQMFFAALLAVCLLGRFFIGPQSQRLVK